MKKCTIIATCLVNSNMINQLEDAERAVRSVFEEEFPQGDFSAWNTDVDDAAAQRIIDTVGRAMRINVKLFIEDLAKMR